LWNPQFEPHDRPLFDPYDRYQLIKSTPDCIWSRVDGAEKYDLDLTKKREKEHEKYCSMQIILVAKVSN